MTAALLKDFVRIDREGFYHFEITLQPNTMKRGSILHRNADSLRP